MASFEIVDVTVAPGPLGILLNGDDPVHPAMLDGFAPISTDGDQGDVEKDGRVGKGSELIGVNEYDFLEWKFTFAEIGQVLRETNHLQRVLRFRVPVVEKVQPTLEIPSSPTGSFHEIDESEVDATLGVVSLSPSSTGTKSWSAKDLRSPRSVADPSLSGTSSPKHVDASKGYDNQIEEARRVAIDVPAGPLGLNLDGSTTDCARVLGFVPLPDGTVGPVQMSGAVLPDSLLIEINGEDVSKLPLSEITAMLGALNGEPRQLVFLLPDPSKARVAAAKKNTRTIPQFGEDLEKRRKMELSLILKHDSTKIKRRECWLMVDAEWMNKWVEFAARGGPHPGPISNVVLLEADWEQKIDGESPGRPDAPREGLEIMKHYRAVTPMVWCLFVELHGINGKIPVQARYNLDIYSDPPRKTDLSPILTEARLKAATLVAELRDKCEIKIED